MCGALRAAGRVLIDRSDVGASAPHELRRRIGYVFQRVGLFPQAQNT